VDPLATVLDLAFARRRVESAVDAALGAHHGLGLGDLALLLELDAAPGGRMRRVDLAARLGITTSGVARQLGPLERIGLVGREPGRGDARLVLVARTRAGERVTREARATAAEAAGAALAAIWPGRDQARLAELLRRARVAGARA
jgi:DNA-binding MarR family transcriptional regulator